MAELAEIDAGDIPQRLTAAFARIHVERMSDVPILNPNLQVETVGTRPWNGHWLSVLITPWFINLILLPQTAEQSAPWKTLTWGDKVLQRFPAGRFDFLLGEEEGLGRYLMCSLFSPVLEFENQEAARIAANSALEALFDAGLDPAAAAKAKAPEPSATADAAAADAEPVDRSRRGFLFGRPAPDEGAA